MTASDLLGAHMVGKHLQLMADTGGIIDVKSYLASLLLKGHTGFTGSQLVYKSGAVETTNNTATAIVTTPVLSSGQGIGLVAFVFGKQSDESSAACAIVAGCGVNAAGTTAVKGTSDITVVEDDASTNVTLVADDTADTLVLKVTGITAETWDWVAHVFYTILDTSS